MSEASAASLDHVEMSREGMRLLLCNDWKAAEDLFEKHKCVSIYRLIFVRTKGQQDLVGEGE